MNISLANDSRVPNLALYQCLDTVLLPYGRIGKISNLNIHDFYEHIRNEWKIMKKSRGVLSKLLISQLLRALEYQTCL